MLFYITIQRDEATDRARERFGEPPPGRRRCNVLGEGKVTRTVAGVKQRNPEVGTHRYVEINVTEGVSFTGGSRWLLDSCSAKSPSQRFPYVGYAPYLTFDPM